MANKHAALASCSQYSRYWIATRTQIGELATEKLNFEITDSEMCCLSVVE
jgi:hypothetical protein